MKRNIIIACYGTLMKGYGNNAYLEQAEFLGSGKTTKKFKMTAASIPFVSESKPISEIFVEVYKINEEELQNIDRLEGHPSFYTRRMTEIKLDSGEIVEAWLYFCDRRYSENIVESGDYRNYKKSKLSLAYAY